MMIFHTTVTLIEAPPTIEYPAQIFGWANMLNDKIC